jgi:hypothetical protein
MASIAQSLLQLACMNFFFNLITVLNLFGLAYLIFLFYKKNTPPQSSPAKSSQFAKINLVRFNPFSDVGGNQSFILVILDNNNCGVIITSLHNRDNTRIYAKQIKNGQGFQSTLSREEKSALAQTIKS